MTQAAALIIATQDRQALGVGVRNLGRKIKRGTSGRSGCVCKELKPGKEQMWCPPGQDLVLGVGVGDRI